jgi:hypothetical protein
MSPADIKKVLQLEPVWDSRWSTNRKLYAGLEDLEIIKLAYRDAHSWQEPAFLIKQERAWCTYRECFSAVVKYNKALLVDAIVYNGDSLDGCRTDLRFSATIKVPDTWLEYFAVPVANHLDDMAKYAYAEYLDEQARTWQEAWKAKLLQ